MAGSDSSRTASPPAPHPGPQQEQDIGPYEHRSDQQHGQQRGRPRIPLTAARIVRAATALIDERGEEHLTMRRLGAELGVAGMSLYRYVPSREELLDAVAAQLVQESAPLAPPGAAGWQELLRLWASQVRRSWLGHPGAFTLMATHQGPLEGLRPPLTHPQWAEAFLAALLADGFSPQKAVAAYRRSASCLLGQLTAPPAPAHHHEPADKRPCARAATQADSSHPPGAPAASLTALSQLRALLAQDLRSVDFDDTVTDLVLRLERLKVSTIT